MMKFDVTSDLTNQQFECFKQLKQKITEEHGPEEAEDEPRLLRFLKAREFDVDKASVMLSNHIAWRKKHKMDYILQDYTVPEVMEKYYPNTVLGFSKDGDIVNYFSYENFDFKGVMRSLTRSQVFYYFMYLLEHLSDALRRKSEEEGKLCQTWIFIVDYNNLSKVNLPDREAIQMLYPVAAAYEANYPERVKAMYCINTTIYFTWMCSLMKPFMSKATKRKMLVFGKGGWKEELLKIIDPEILPAFLGGKLTDPDGDPACRTIVHQGGVVPPEYYVRKGDCRMLREVGVEKFIVSRRSTTTKSLQVTKPGSVMEWDVESEKYDIGLGLQFAKDDSMLNNPVEILPVRRIDRSGSESGIHRCQDAGTYIFVFDNTFSWFRSKTIYFRAYVRIGEETDIRKTRFSIDGSWPGTYFFEQRASQQTEK